MAIICIPKLIVEYFLNLLFYINTIDCDKKFESINYLILLIISILMKIYNN